VRERINTRVSWSAIRKILLGMVVIALACVGSSTAAIGAETFPDRPLRLIVPFPPGGSTDVLGRLLAKEMGRELGQSVVVQNKPGAGGDIASVYVAHAAPDGYTLLLVSSGFVVNPTMSATTYDPVKDFAPISYVASVPSLLVVGPKVPATTLAQLVSLIKSDHGNGFNFASTGIGSVQQLAGELFKREARLNMTHIPYNGTGPAISALLGGQVQMLVASVPALEGYVNAGTVKALATTMPARIVLLPNVPTFKESGYPSVVAVQIQALLAPAGTPKPIVDRLNRVLSDVIARPEVRKQLLNLGFLPEGGPPSRLAEEIRSETVVWGEVVKAAHIRPE